MTAPRAISHQIQSPQKLAGGPPLKSGPLRRAPRWLAASAGILALASACGASPESVAADTAAEATTRPPAELAASNTEEAGELLLRPRSMEGGAADLREIRAATAVADDQSSIDGDATNGADADQPPADSAVAQDALDLQETAVRPTATPRPTVTAEPDSRATATPAAQATPVLTATADEIAPRDSAARDSTADEIGPGETAPGDSTASDNVDDLANDPAAGDSGTGAPSVGSGKDFSGQALVDEFFDDDLPNADFSGADLSFSLFVGPGLSLAGANFSGANLQHTVFNSVDLTGADFTDADLSEMLIFDSQLARVIWGNTICPDGENSDDVGGTCDGNLLE